MKIRPAQRSTALCWGAGCGLLVRLPAQRSQASCDVLPVSCNGRSPVHIRGHTFLAHSCVHFVHTSVLDFQAAASVPCCRLTSCGRPQTLPQAALLCCTCCPSLTIPSSIPNPPPIALLSVMTLQEVTRDAADIIASSPSTLQQQLAQQGADLEADWAEAEANGTGALTTTGAAATVAAAVCYCCCLLLLPAAGNQRRAMAAAYC